MTIIYCQVEIPEASLPVEFSLILGLLNEKSNSTVLPSDAIFAVQCVTADAEQPTTKRRESRLQYGIARCSIVHFKEFHVHPTFGPHYLANRLKRWPLSDSLATDCQIGHFPIGMNSTARILGFFGRANRRLASCSYILCSILKSSHASTSFGCS